MQALITAVSYDGFHSHSNASRQLRLTLLNHLCSHALQVGAGLLCLPAGYFYVPLKRRGGGIPTTQQVQRLPIVRQASNIASKVGVSIAFGVDTERVGKRSVRHREQRGTLPYFLIVCDHAGNIQVFHQQSMTNSAPIGRAINLPSRVVTIPPARGISEASKRVLFLACGEIFNLQNRQALGSLHQNNADVVSDHAHGSMGQGLVPALSAWYKAGSVPVIHSQHLVGGSLHRIDAAGAHQATLAGQCLAPGWTPPTAFANSWAACVAVSF